MNRKELFLFSIIIFLTVIAWILVDIYKTKDVSNLEAQLSSNLMIKFKVNPGKILKILKDKTP